ncbi:restriction endonuclease subunit S [Lysobacter sp. CW239]|uniref:restriction endonuclease subunit S n=1 Tax=Lysobacteraceae TaxID=32033 RepID=UPI0009FBBD4A|nr:MULTISPECIES: restriction endonuclease subunit S [Lysobacter]QOD91739.1 restriction endonuclease subunit S [Lysobacter sp. CW239]
MSVATAALAEVAEINPRFDRAGFANQGEVVTFVPMARVSEVSGVITSEDHRPLGELLKGFTPFADRDVLVAKITPCFENGKIAHARISKRAGFGSTEFHVVRADAQRLDDRYLFHFLRQPLIRVAGEKRMTGSGGQRRVPKAFLESLKIPLPPLAEQRRISAILDKADALRAKRREAIAKLDQLLQSVFLDMFGDPVANPKDWPVGAIAQHASKIGSGATPRGGESAYKAEGTSLIRSMNVRDGQFRHKNLARIDDEQAAKLDNVVVQSDDVLLNITGASVARVCRAPSDALPARVNQHVAIIRCKSTLSPVYLERVLLAMKQSLLMVAGGGATREAITKQQIEDFRIPIPAAGVQERFTLIAERIKVQLIQMQQSADGFEELFSSLQHRAFTGTL